MTVFPSFDVDDMAEFTGRPEMTFPEHVDEALLQAVFFIKARTKIYEWPDDPELQQAFKYAILDLANQMYLERQYDRIKANPLASETIGSYSYSKSTAATAALFTARPTGLLWLDLLLEMLIQKEIEGFDTHGSVHVFENDDVYLHGKKTHRDMNEPWVLGPKDAPHRPHRSSRRYEEDWPEGFGF